MSETDLEAVRRRFLEELFEEQISFDSSGREVGRPVRAVTIDVERGTAVLRRQGGDEEGGGLVSVEIDLTMLGRSWGALAARGREAFASDDDQQNALDALRVLLEEEVDGVDSQDSELVLRADGLFGPR